MDEFERRLAESLRSRAEDADPTPALWTEVRDRFSRRRWLTWTYALAGAAAVLVLAVVVAPGVWDALRGPDRLDILDEPIQPPADRYGDSLMATTDGERILVHGTGEEPTGVAFPEAGESIESVAIRPGSQRDDLSLVYVIRDVDGRFRLYAARRVLFADRMQWMSTGLPGEVQPREGLTAAPVLTWSPDGDHLAWLETGDDAPELRVATWTGDVIDMDDRDDPAVVAADRSDSFTLRGLPAGPARVDGWVWTEMAPDAGAVGHLVVVGAGPEAWEVGLQRQADGAIELLFGAEPVDRGDAALVAFADGSPDLARFSLFDGAAPIGPVYELLVADHDEGRLTPALRATDQRGEEIDLAMNDLMWNDIAGDPDRAWLRAAGDRLLVGTVDGVWLYENSLDGGTPRLLEGVVHADIHQLVAEPTPPVEPTPAVTEEPDADQTYPDVAMLATDGSEIFVIPPGSAQDEPDREHLASLPSGYRAVAVAVRPGSTTTDLDAVVWVRVGDAHELHRLRYAGTNAQLEPLPEPYQVSDDVAPGSRPRPVWSPDGAYLAWTELPADETAGGPRLRTIGWDDGPGTGDPATDNAAFELDDIPLTTVRAEVWTGSAGGDECPPADSLTLRLTSEQLEAWAVRMEVQPDGALSLPADATELVLDDPYGTPVAYALDERVCEAMFAPYGLYAADADEDGEVDLFVQDPIGHQGFPVSEEVRTAELPALGEPRDGEGAPWITGLGDVVIVGVDGDAWLTGRPLPEFEERPLRIGGTVVHAEPIG